MNNFDFEIFYYPKAGGQMGDHIGSDEDEDDRKGGMEKKDILRWLWDVSTNRFEMEAIPDYPRYQRGPNVGHIITELSSDKNSSE